MPVPIEVSCGGVGGMRAYTHQRPSVRLHTLLMQPVELDGTDAVNVDRFVRYTRHQIQPQAPDFTAKQQQALSLRSHKRIAGCVHWAAAKRSSNYRQSIICHLIADLNSALIPT